MITHEEARTKADRMIHHTHLFWLNYVTQQEQFAKDVAVLKDTLNAIKTICNNPCQSWILSLAEISKRYIEIDNLINTYEEKLTKGVEK